MHLTTFFSCFEFLWVKVQQSHVNSHQVSQSTCFPMNICNAPSFISVFFTYKRHCWCSGAYFFGNSKRFGVSAFFSGYSRILADRSTRGPEVSSWFDPLKKAYYVELFGVLEKTPSSCVTQSVFCIKTKTLVFGVMAWAWHRSDKMSISQPLP